MGLDVAWLARRLEQQFSNGGEAGSRVQVMTLHKAKGLEFDCVFIPQLAKVPRSEGRELLLWDEHSGPDRERRFLLAADDHSERGAPTLYNYLDKLRKDKTRLEATRLLYVGATRAIRHLCLSASLRLDQGTGQLLAPPANSLLSPIWQVFRNQALLHGAGSSPVAVGARAAGKKLQRLALAATPCNEVPVSVTAGASITPRPGNFLERCVGTVVHQALDELSRLSELPRETDRQQQRRWRAALARLGLWGEALELAQSEVEQALAATLQDAAGRWLLRTDHPQARSEWALTWMDAATGRPADLVIDRCFVDAQSGIRWLVDYKTSRPEPAEPIEAFLVQQAKIYREQLLRYRQALREITAEPLRCALYFTALGRLYPVTELDLGAKEMA
jgi:ATP-dependent exoDNAse (exonuclease V) beta subunit